MCSSICGTQQTSTSGVSGSGTNGTVTNTNGIRPEDESPSVKKIKNVISKRRRTIYVFYFMAFLDLLAVSLFLPLLSTGMRDLGATPFMTGLIGSAYGAIQLFSSPVMGWGSDIYGPKLVMFISLVATAVAYVVQGSALNIAMMLVARGLAGIFKHTQTVGKSIVSELSTKDKSHVIGNFNAFGSMGFILGPTLGAHIAQLDKGFQIVCYISAAAFLFNAVLLAILVPDPSKLMSSKPSPKLSPKSKSKKLGSKGDSDEVSRLTKLKTSFKNADIHSLILLAVRFLFSFATLVFRENLTITLLEKYNSNLVNSGYLTSLQALMSTIMGFCVGPVNAFIYKGNSLYMVLITGILKTIVLFTLFWSSSYWLAGTMLVIVSALNPFLRVGITAVSLEGHHSDIGTILGFSQSATSMARMISPTAAGLALSMSTDGPFLLAAVSSICGIIATLAAQRFAKQQKGTPHAKTD
ncbi:Major facilitator superfamily domain-containing protein 9 [Orchesella cincta]|uniref:Major facilitator superfamily domain-containing protein 9 n=1 Tax=Orchesella cincta TaxID=48709 RepID=A0A1D2N042_ORCCI|nr:Major facilitator superfamily domain-containing protein 9 [Orchesella cincta]